MEETTMKKNQKKMRVTVGDLIAALFEETKKVTRDRVEQNLMVYAALKEILNRRKYVLRPVPVKAH
jgi:hypothetical protein